MVKAPFERIFSFAERKKILHKIAKENLKVIIKGPQNKVLELKAEEIDSAFNLSGNLNENPNNFKDFEKVTALFHVDRERYFLTTRLKIKKDKWVLLDDQQFYKFNRRSAFRVDIPKKFPILFQVSSIRNIEVNKKAAVIEFSTTGARLQSTGDVRFSTGATLKGSLQWGKDKALLIDALVIHSPEKNIYGVRFINLNSATVNRLKMLSIEIQQTIYFA
jgi:hypothetical protein